MPSESQMRESLTAVLPDAMVTKTLLQGSGTQSGQWIKAPLSILFWKHHQNRVLVMDQPGLHSELRFLLSTKTLKHPRKAVNRALFLLEGNWIGLMTSAYLPMVLVLLPSNSVIDQSI